MSEQSEFLRALGLDPEGEEGDEESAGQLQSGTDNKTMKQVRDTIKRLDNQLKKATKEAEELREFKQQVVREQSKGAVQSAFEKVWTDKEEAERNARLFFRGVPEDAEVGEDAIAEYLRDFGPKQVAEGPVPGAPAPTPPDQGGGFAPASGGEAPVAGMVSSEDMLKLMQAGDFEAVTKAVENRRLEKQDVPWATKPE